MYFMDAMSLQILRANLEKQCFFFFATVFCFFIFCVLSNSCFFSTWQSEIYAEGKEIFTSTKFAGVILLAWDSWCDATLQAYSHNTSCNQ